MTVHSIICWDCSFRNFHHTIDAMVDQDYDRAKFELIYVEQRSRQISDAFNHNEGLPSLGDRHDEFQGDFSFEVLFLDHPKEEPYHLGRCVNRGMEIAEGEFLSVMDGDLLLPPDFLSALEEYHRAHEDAVVNLHRHMCPEPAGVPKEDWKEQQIDYETCLDLCPTKDNPHPDKVSNKGPMISAPRSLWDAVDGYDEHRIWSTGVSRLGQDVTARLEMQAGRESKALPNQAAVHPWHPQGFHRSGIDEQRMLDIQQEIIDWTREHEVRSWKERESHVERIYSQNRQFLDEMIFGQLGEPHGSLFDEKGVRYNVEIAVGKLRKLIHRLTP